MPFGIDPNTVAVNPQAQADLLMQRPQIIAAQGARVAALQQQQQQIQSDRGARAAQAMIAQEQLRIDRERLTHSKSLSDASMELEKIKLAQNALLESSGIKARKELLEAETKAAEKRDELARIASQALLEKQAELSQRATAAELEIRQRGEMEQIGARQTAAETALLGGQTFEAEQNRLNREAALEGRRIEGSAQAERLSTELGARREESAMTARERWQNEWADRDSRVYTSLLNQFMGDQAATAAAFEQYQKTTEQQRQRGQEQKPETQVKGGDFAPGGGRFGGRGASEDWASTPMTDSLRQQIVGGLQAIANNEGNVDPIDVVNSMRVKFGISEDEAVRLVNENFINAETVNPRTGERGKVSRMISSHNMSRWQSYARRKAR